MLRRLKPGNGETIEVKVKGLGLPILLRRSSRARRFSLQVSEARRGAMDPTYLVYTLGKWHILDLRDELKQRLGPQFDLRAFHDAFLSEGPSPLPVVRAALLRRLAGVTPARKEAP